MSHQENSPTHLRAGVVLISLNLQRFPYETLGKLADCFVTDVVGDDSAYRLSALKSQHFSTVCYLIRSCSRSQLLEEKIPPHWKHNVTLTNPITLSDFRANHLIRFGC